MLAMIALAALCLGASPQAVQRFSFEGPQPLAGVVVAATGEAQKRMPAPKPERGGLLLLESWWKSGATAAFAAPTAPAAGEWLVLQARVMMNTGTEGMGFLLLDTRADGAEPTAPALEAWEAPSHPHAFGIGLDASDPPNRDPFRGSGNAYDRPQHELSIHWDGAEIVKAVTPTDFRDEQWHDLAVGVQFLTGAAEVTVLLDGKPVFERYLVPNMTPIPARLAIGARNAETAGDLLVDEVALGVGPAAAALPEPTRLVAHDRVLNDKDHGSLPVEVEFPADMDAVGRIVLTLRLDKPQTRFDPWDRIAHLWIDDPKLGKVELLRYITPYHRGGEWSVDVSDFRPLLRGRTKLLLECGTQGEGWVVSTIFTLHRGPAERTAIAYEPLWCGDPEIGNPDRPVTAFYDPRTLRAPAGADAAALRTVVTGHGMEPNTGNAAEFLSIGRTVTANGTRFRSMLWKTDNYLNPCRPQGGTWKYDRAGWAPGDVVRPWMVELTPVLRAVVPGAEGARTLAVTYELDPYVNEGRGKTWAPTHATQSAMVWYRSGEARARIDPAAPLGPALGSAPGPTP